MRLTMSAVALAALPFTCPTFEFRYEVQDHKRGRELCKGDQE